MDQAGEPTLGLCEHECRAHVGCVGSATDRLCALSHQGPEFWRQGHGFQGQGSGRWQECAPTPSLPPPALPVGTWQVGTSQRGSDGTTDLGHPCSASSVIRPAACSTTTTGVHLSLSSFWKLIKSWWQAPRGGSLASSTGSMEGCYLSGGTRGPLSVCFNK